MIFTGNIGKCSGWRPVSEGSESRRRTGTGVWEGLGPYHARTFDQWQAVAAFHARGGCFEIKSIG